MPKHSLNRPNRKSPRLKGYDYAQAGAYFITICTRNRVHLFGDVVNSEMKLNAFGQIVVEAWRNTSVVRPYVVLDASVVMPNHLHGILFLIHDAHPVGATRRVAHHQPNGPKPQSVSAIIGGFKSHVTRRINQLRDTPGASVWQRSFHDHIIRNEKSLNHLRAYVEHNPARWETDPFFA